MSEKKARTDKRISLAPLSPDEALKLAMQTGRHPKEEVPPKGRDAERPEKLTPDARDTNQGR